MIDQAQFDAKLEALLALGAPKAVVFVSSAEERVQLVSTLNTDHWVASLLDHTVDTVGRRRELDNYATREESRYLVVGFGFVTGFRVANTSKLVFWDPYPNEIYREQALARVDRSGNHLIGRQDWHELFIEGDS